jgi:hypothetical protein
MTNRDNRRPSSPFVEAAFEAIANWVTSYHNVTGFNKEINRCSPNEVMRMAAEIGVTPNQLEELTREGGGSANLLKRMLVALHVDPKVIAEIDPLVMREMKWLCITCTDKKQCEHDIASGTAAEHFHKYCPNAVSIDELLNQSGRPLSN